MDKGTYEVHTSVLRFLTGTRAPSTSKSAILFEMPLPLVSSDFIARNEGYGKLTLVYSMG